MRSLLLCMLVIVAVCPIISTTAEPIFGPQAATNDTIPKQLARGAVGLRAGIINTGTLEEGDIERDPNLGATGGVFFDVPTLGKLMTTFSIDIYDVRLKRVSERFIDVSLGFKWVFHKYRQKMAWKPGAAVGIGYLADMGQVSASTFLTVKGFLEMMLFTDGRHAWVFDLGWVVAPVGSNEVHEVSLAPSIYLQVGIAY